MTAKDIPGPNPLVAELLATALPPGLPREHAEFLYRLVVATMIEREETTHAPLVRQIDKLTAAVLAMTQRADDLPGDEWKQGRTPDAE